MNLIKDLDSIRRYQPEISEALGVFEIQLLLFPIVVVAVANLSFIVGATCSSWQWWLSSSVVCMIPLICRSSRLSSLLSIAGFFFVMFGMAVATFVSCDGFGSDECACHLPAIHMLANGWNPLRQVAPESVGALFGFDPWDMRCLHLLFYQKSAWIFDAVAYRVHGDPLSVMMPGVYYLVSGVLVVVFRCFCRGPVLFRCLAVGLVYKCCYCPYSDLDTMVGFAALGLMISMLHGVQSGKSPLVNLLVFTFWMFAVKPAGMLVAIVFWGVYCACLLYSRKFHIKVSWRKNCGAALVFSLVLFVTHLSPYFTSFREYGHPLYPHRTVDPVRYPAKNLIGDFYNRNDDCSKMSVLAYYVNAYVSPGLIKRYYNWKFDRSDFHPFSLIWKRSNVDVTGHDGTYPLRFSQRLTIMITLVLLLLFSKTRMLGIMAMLALAAMPPVCYGYMRYFQWMHGLWAFPLVVFIENVVSWCEHAKWIVYSGILLFVVPGYLKVPMYAAARIDNKLQLCTIKPSAIYTNRYGEKESSYYADHPEALTCVCAEDPAHSQINYIKFLQRRLANFANVPIVPLELSAVSRYERLQLSVYVDKSTVIPEMLICTPRGSGVSRILFYPKYLCTMFSKKLMELYEKLHGFYA